MNQWDILKIKLCIEAAKVDLTLKISEDSIEAFFSVVVLLCWFSVHSKMFCFLKEKTLPCCVPVGFPFLLSARRHRCVILTKVCASWQVLNLSQACNWLCQFSVSVLYPFKSKASSLAVELLLQMYRFKFWATVSLWKGNFIVFLQAACCICWSGEVSPASSRYCVTVLQ